MVGAQPLADGGLLVTLDGWSYLHIGEKVCLVVDVKTCLIPHCNFLSIFLEVVVGPCNVQVCLANIFRLVTDVRSFPQGI